MDHIDLIDRLIPTPAQTLVVETPKGELVLVDTERHPQTGDTVLHDDSFTPYHAGVNASGVAYCIIKFL